LTYTNLNPLDPEGQIERYKIFLKKLDLKAAKEAIQKVIDNFPRYPGAYFMLGELYRESQNHEDAMKAALIEIKNNPNFVPAYVLAAAAYNLQKDSANALQTANKALKLLPTYVPALIEAAIANHNLKAYAAALSMLERAKQLDSGNPKIYKRLGVLYYDMGKNDLVKSHLTKYLEMYPDAPDKAEVEKYLEYFK
jgi:tetratricopeptide (TPR) repeat protein